MLPGCTHQPTWSLKVRCLTPHDCRWKDIFDLLCINETGDLSAEASRGPACGLLTESLSRLWSASAACVRLHLVRFTRSEGNKLTSRAALCCLQSGIWESRPGEAVFTASASSSNFLRNFMQHRKECVLLGSRLSIDCRMLVTWYLPDQFRRVRYKRTGMLWTHCLGIIPASHCIWTPVIMLLLATQIWTPLTANDAPELPPACTAIQQIPG